MFSRWLFLLGFTLILQVTSAGWIQKQVEYYLSPFTHSIGEVTDQLQANLNDFEKKKEELQAQKDELRKKIEELPENCQSEGVWKYFEMFDKWDFDSCVNVTDDMKTASDLVVQGSIYVRNITDTAKELGGNILDCPNQEYSVIFYCYHSNLKVLKSRLEDFKDETVPFVHQSTLVAASLRSDFDRCVGIPETLRYRVEEQIKNVKC